jgi:hypothetical protein
MVVTWPIALDRLRMSVASARAVAVDIGVEFGPDLSLTRSQRGDVMPGRTGFQNPIKTVGPGGLSSIPIGRCK